MSSSYSQNVNLRGDAGQFGHMSLTGDVNIQAAYRQKKIFRPLLLSGGTDGPLDNVPTAGLLIQADINNQGPVYVGGIGDDRAYVNLAYPGDHNGTVLQPGQSWPDPVLNANLVTFAGTKNDIVIITAFLTQPQDVPLSTTPPPQYLPPVFQTSQPVNGGLGISNISTLSAIFSQSLDPATVTTANITISPAIPIYTPSVDLSNPNQVDIALSPCISFSVMMPNYIDCTTNALLQVGETAGSQASYSFWFRMFMMPAASSGLLSRGSLGMQVYVDTSGILRCDFNYNSKGVLKSSTGANVTDGSWHHAVITNNANGDSKIYLDGVLKVDTVTSDFLAATGGSSHFLIASTYATNYMDNGRISDVRVYSVELTQAEVTTLFTGNDVTRGEVEHWDFHEGSGTTVTGLINGIVGTLTGVGGMPGPQWIRSNLVENTKYTVTFGTGLASSPPNDFTNRGTQSFSFTTDFPVTVQTVQPAPNATNIATNTQIQILTNRVIDGTTVNNVMMTPLVVMVFFVDSNNNMQIDGIHTANLSNSTTYTHTVPPGMVLDSLGFPVTMYSWSFTTAAGAPPPVAPVVSSVIPASNATGVIPLHASIVIQLIFSESMDGTTINNTNITLKQTSNNLNIASTVTLGGDTVTVTIAPNSDLLTNTQYTITATTSVKSAAGVGGLNMASTYTSKFTTEAAPIVSSFNPANGATGVAVTVAPTITFAQAMLGSSITTSTCNITGVTSTVSLDSTKKIVTITPNASLANSTTYTINATTGCKQLDGVPLGSSVSSSFTTIGPTPSVSSTNPANNATNVATSIAPSATFNMAMDPTTITSNTFYLTDNNNVVQPSTTAASGGNTIFTLTPNSSLSYSTIYKLNITTGCKSAAGVALASNVTVTFTTAAATYTLRYNVAEGSSHAGGYSSSYYLGSTNGYYAVGEKVDSTKTGQNLVNNMLTKVALADLNIHNGSLSGSSLNVEIRDSNGNLKYGFASSAAIPLDSYTPSNTPTASHNITLPAIVDSTNTYKCANGDVVLIRWINPPGGADLEIGKATSPPYKDMIFAKYASSGNGAFTAYSSLFSDDLAASIYSSP